MGLDADLALARLALARGVITEAALAEAIAASLRTPGVPLLEVLRRDGAASEPDLRALESALGQGSRETLVRGEAGDGTTGGGGDRYEIRGELGRGGLGAVLNAFDRDLGREVALKVLHGARGSEAAERFILEARVTGGLEHPNIVPVHEAGVLREAGGDARPYFTMKKIRGEDLGRILKRLAAGDGAARAAYPLRALLRRFVDICHAVAFAHARGVLHRDLKPGNVMIGDFGETLVVDWGLARDRSRTPEPGIPARPGDPPGGTGDSRMRISTPLTLEGDILGTPAYMSPEQAWGRVAEIDERTDVFNLGGILYEILALRPPIQGSSLDDVLERARAAEIPRLLESPADLAAICHRSLMARRAERYGSAAEMAQEVQRWLDGEQERERAGRLADLAAGKARDALRKLEEARAEEAALAPMRNLGPEIPEEAEAWKTEGLYQAARRAGTEAWAEADAALTEALGHDGRHAGARRLKAEMAWRRFEEAEARDDADAMLLTRGIVETHDDGTFAVRLRGDGTVRIRPMAYACACLTAGREVTPGEFWDRGYHLFSGRTQAPRPGCEGEPRLEPVRATRFRVHGPSCVQEPVKGARVWIWKIELSDGRLFPVTPSGEAGDACPAGILDSLWESGSPYRPRGPGRRFDAALQAPCVLPMGSWLAVVEAPGVRPLRLPFAISRCAEVDLDPTLFRAGELPAGMVQVARGSFPYQGDLGAFASDPLRIETADDLLFARHPVTCAEYAAFLDDLATGSPDEARARSPREAAASGPYWPGPPYRVPTAERLAADPALRRTAASLARTTLPWDDNWPVVGISWHDALAYAAWVRSRTGAVETLPLQEEWEKAARGADRRIYPWGPRFSYRWLNANHSRPEPGPSVVTDWPDDESPYGVRGCAGNCRDFCLNEHGQNQLTGRMVRGGTWTDPRQRCRPALQGFNDPRHVYYNLGFRLVRRVRLGGIAGAGARK
ncbi:MAG: SUMF1/EgtB/PvdO family nonheme iron enzyme [Candidatus Brocadiae bacterium]|nr:SUMF1/EgtB/PvdO family nonheme iron enzyme [Candidatus Brocadiia bacterium]